MSSKQQRGLVILWSADAGAATREFRITRTTMAACLVLVSALLGVCLWLGWELGIWSAKPPVSTASAQSMESSRVV